MSTRSSIPLSRHFAMKLRMFTASELFFRRMYLADIAPPVRAYFPTFSQTMSKRSRPFTSL